MKQFPVTLNFPVHWGDMDSLHHVNNAKYLTWFESARIELFRQVGIIADRPSSVGPILATTTCDFLKPVVWPANVVVGVRVPSVGNTSFTTEYGVSLENNPENLVARGTGVIVLVNYETGEKVRVSDDIRQKIDRLTS